MKKNGKIELLRFLFSLSVLGFHLQKYIPGEVSLKNGIHFSFFPHGAIGVEFFFVLSGFLMASSVYMDIARQSESSLGCATFAFVKKKFMAVLPMRIVVFLLLFAVAILVKSWDMTTVIKNLVSNIPGLLLIQMSGIGKMYINSIEWYLSAMLIGMFILYPLLRKYYDAFSRIAAPLIAVFTLGYMYRSYGRLTGVAVWEGLCYRSMLRAVAELCLGIVCFVVYQHIKDAKWSPIQRGVFTCFETICWLAAFTMIMLTVPRNYEFCILLFITLGVPCAFSKQAFCSKLFDNAICFYLGKLSLPVYLCQLIPINLVPHFLDFLSVKQQMAVAFVATILLAIVTLHGTNALCRPKKANIAQ